MSCRYVRKPHSRCARTKNEDVQIVRLHCHVSHYRAVRDARSYASPISIHWRCTKPDHISDYKTHPRRALRVCVTDLILGWGPYGTNMRHVQSLVSPITKKSETRFILARYRFNC
jgi:hypothetical protein